MCTEDYHFKNKSPLLGSPVSFFSISHSCHCLIHSPDFLDTYTFHTQIHSHTYSARACTHTHTDKHTLQESRTIYRSTTFFVIFSCQIYIESILCNKLLLSKFISTDATRVSGMTTWFEKAYSRVEFCALHRGIFLQMYRVVV